MADDTIKVPMKIKLYAGNVLVAEVESSELFAFMLGEIIKLEAAMQPPTGEQSDG